MLLRRAERTWLAAVLAAGLAACGSPLSVRARLLDAGAIRANECVAVLPFANATAVEHAGKLVANALATELWGSGRFNTLAPDEIVHLLELMQVPYGANGSYTTAQRYGQALGVRSVLTGTVTEMGLPAPSARSIKQPVVGFVAALVSADSGKVLWTASASNYHHAVLLETPESRDAIVREVAQAATESLVDARDDARAGGAPCAALQAKLFRGVITPPPPPLPQPEPPPSVASPAGAGTGAVESPARGQAPAPAPAEIGLPPLPTDLPPLPGDLPPLPSDLPPMPGELPPLPSDLPPLPVEPPAAPPK